MRLHPPRALAALLIVTGPLTACDTTPTCASICERRAECDDMVPDDCVSQCEELLAPYREEESCAEPIDSLLVCQDMVLDTCESAGACSAESLELVTCATDSTECEAACEASRGGGCSFYYGSEDCGTVCAGFALVASRQGCEAEASAREACVQSNAASPTCAEDCLPAAQAYLDCSERYCMEHPGDTGC